MRYRISNIANKEELEHFTGLSFKYPKLYSKVPLVTGFEESLLPIITSTGSEHLEYGIWGLLPDNYNDDWEEFQKIINTLTITQEDLKKNSFYHNSLKLKRCVIAATGFFTSHLCNGEVYPYYVYNSERTPFYLAGYYNCLSDGFMTFTILLTKVDDSIKKIQNISNLMPKILTTEEKNIWLSKNLSNTDTSNLTNKKCSVQLKAHPIAKELYKMGILHSTMLEPVDYQNIPNF